MKQLIDAEKLKQEIEKRIKSAESCPFIEAEFGAEMRREGKTQTYNEILSLITSLQQEQPKVDLVAELRHHLATTPKEQLEKEWKELEHWNSVGPTVQEFLYGKQSDEQPEYGYLSTEYIHGRKPRWSVGDVLAHYICTSNEEGEYPIGKIVNVGFDEEDGWVYTFEDESMWNEQSLVEEEAYKKN